MTSNLRRDDCVNPSTKISIGPFTDIGIRIPAIENCVQYYEVVSQEFRGLSGLIRQKYWTERLNNIYINQLRTAGRVAAFEPGGRRFESVRARLQIKSLALPKRLNATNVAKT